MSGSIHVAVAVIVQHQQVLIALRKPDQHQGGLWEFPGGKVETDETVQQALSREIAEEISVEVISAQPLIEVRHDYGDKSVFLDVWIVDKFAGTPTGREGQIVKWCDIAALHQYDFPAANQAIVQAVQHSIDKQAITE